MLYDFMLLLEKGAFYLAGERMKAPQFFDSIRGKSEVFGMQENGRSAFKQEL